MFFSSGVLIPGTDAIGLGGMQGPSSVKGLPTRGAGAQDLVKSRTGEDTLQLKPVEAPLPVRLRLGRLEKARNQRLHLVDCMCVEERAGKRFKNNQFHDGILPLTQ